MTSLPLGLTLVFTVFLALFFLLAWAHSEDDQPDNDDDPLEPLPF